MNSDSLRYLARNTDITYLAEGSIARALIETINLEIARLGEFMSAVQANTFLDSASGPYLDVIGETYGLKRLSQIGASASESDKNIKFSVETGRLGDAFPDPQNSDQGVISPGVEISTADSSIVFRTSQHTYFDRNQKEVFVPVKASSAGTNSNVGKNRLTSHNGPSNVNVTNTKAIANGLTKESDRNYKFRIANNLAASPTGNESSIRIALLSLPDVADIKMINTARGAGTFDALLIPVGNTVNSKSLNEAQLAIEQVSAFGVNGRAVQPGYIHVKVSVRLIPVRGGRLSTVSASKQGAKNAIIGYLETIPIGGELVINRLRSSIMESVGNSVRDIRILEICLNGRPHIIRNIQPRKDEVFIPDIIEVM